jgi:60 kDa SS-A/Ro ribonucleoprotein
VCGGRDYYTALIQGEIEMANAELFRSANKGDLAPQTDTVNNAGGTAYALSEKAALANYATTGCFNNTFYVGSSDQVDTVKTLCQSVSAEFIAKTAIYARKNGMMKDMPCALLCILLSKDTQLFKGVFPKVVDNVKMLRTFSQMLRSGVFGRKSFGTVAAKAVKGWLDGWNDANKLFNSSVGNNPSLADIIRLTHPKPKNDEFSALFAYLCGFPHNACHLPENVKRYELLKRNYAEGVVWNELPDLNWQYLTSVKLTEQNWKTLAANASWQTTRMNLQTFYRHGVFDSRAAVADIASRLKNPEEIAKAKVFPYQLLMAYKMASNLPHDIQEALQDAMEIAVSNVPGVEGWSPIVCVDTSGSMSSSISGSRAGATSNVSCSDVAGLIAAATVRANPRTRVVSFDTDARHETVNPRDSVMTNAQKLSRSGGGTNIASALALINRSPDMEGNMIIIVSDNEANIDGRGGRWRGQPTGVHEMWNEYAQKNPGAKLVCINIQPNCTTQAKEGGNVINVSGFSDDVFTMLSRVASGAGYNAFVKTIEDVNI